MNFRQLEIFRAIMITGSASQAAELLGITQPGVSRAIGDLEYRLGFPLFDRVKGRLLATPEGKMFFREVDDSFIGLDSLRASAARIRDFGSGRLRIASLAALGSTLVPRAVKLFHAAHPKIALTLQIMSSAQVRDYVSNNRFDVGIAADEVDLSGVDHIKFMSVRAVCAMHPDHPLAALEKVRPEDLDGVEFIALSPEDRARARMFEGLARAGSNPNIIVETPASLTICALALEGVGVGLVNPAAADGFALRGLVLKPYEPAVYFKSLVLFRPDMRRARLVKAFVASLNEALHEGPVPST